MIRQPSFGGRPYPGSGRRKGYAGASALAQPVTWILVALLLTISAGAAWYSATSKKEIQRLLTALSDQGTRLQLVDTRPICSNAELSSHISSAFVASLFGCSVQTGGTLADHRKIRTGADLGHPQKRCLQLEQEVSSPLNAQHLLCSSLN